MLILTVLRSWHHVHNVAPKDWDAATRHYLIKGDFSYLINIYKPNLHQQFKRDFDHVHLVALSHH